MDYLYYARLITRAIFEIYELYKDDKEVQGIYKDVLEDTKNTVDLFMYERAEYTFVEQMIIMRVKQLDRIQRGQQ